MISIRRRTRRIMLILEGGIILSEAPSGPATRMQLAASLISWKLPCWKDVTPHIGANLANSCPAAHS